MTAYTIKPMKRVLALMFFMVSISLSGWGQGTGMQQERAQLRQQQPKAQHVQKRYNIFFRINSPKIEAGFHGNGNTLETMRKDIEATLQQDGALPDSLLILSTASPDGSYAFNKWLAGARAASTEKLLLEMFPQFKDAHIQVEFLEEDWDGLRQVLRKNPNFPQREEMLAVIDRGSQIDDKEKALRALKQGWRYLVNNHIYALRNSSITLCVVMTGEADEYTRAVPIPPVETSIKYTPHFPVPPLTMNPAPVQYPESQDEEWMKMILGVRTNLIAPGQTIGLEFPIKDRWSVGIDYWYPWFVSKHNKWCTEQLALFLDGKYWFTGDKYAWTDTEKLQGHAVGMYVAAGYYDYQDIDAGDQGEYINVGFDYTFAKPIFQNRCRLEFHIGVGFVRTWYRPYKPSSDFEHLIKDPGIKHKTSNFFGPTRGGVSFVVPILMKYKNGQRNGIRIGGLKK